MPAATARDTCIHETAVGYRNQEAQFWFGGIFSQRSSPKSLGIHLLEPRSTFTQSGALGRNISHSTHDGHRRRVSQNLLLLGFNTTASVNFRPFFGSTKLGENVRSSEVSSHFQHVSTQEVSAVVVLSAIFLRKTRAESRRNASNVSASSRIFKFQLILIND